MATTPPPSWRSLLAPFASLKLTVWLLAFALGLVFFATIDQVHLGIHEVVQIYFRQWIAYYDFRTGGGWDDVAKAVIPPKPAFRLWMPGGYMLGTVLLLNLIAAHAVRFKLSWKKSGIVVVHLGIVLILLGELFTGLTARETQMTIDEGQTVNFSEDKRRCELAIVDLSNPQREKHVVIREDRLKPGSQFTTPDLPFRIEVIAYFPNARLAQSGQQPAGDTWVPVPADQGLGSRLMMMPVDRATQADEVDFPLAVVRLYDGTRTLGSWAVSRQIDMAQPIPGHAGNWQISLRTERSYKPFCLTLRDFQHNKYPGTNIAKDFSSYLTLTEKGVESGRDFRIWMNHPLRHGGYTFYQGSFMNNDATTILQVVRNPSWLIPYIACTMVFLGLALQFGLSLHQHMSKRAPAPPR